MIDLEKRKKGIGGSEIGAVCGKSKWATPYDVWSRKIGLVEDVPYAKVMERGHKLEPIVADMYAEETGRDVAPAPFFKHPVHTFLLGNPDRFIFKPTPSARFVHCQPLCPFRRVLPTRLEAGEFGAELVAFITKFSYGLDGANNIVNMKFYSKTIGPIPPRIFNTLNKIFDFFICF